MHFIRYGWKEGRNPSDYFNTNYYLNLYEDVRALGMNPLVHYLLYGKKEGRDINFPQSNNNNKVGIVIVSHNASLATRITLASLRIAKNKTPFDVIVVDNASDISERNAIRNALERHVSEGNLSWKYIQSEENLGFSGGNNIGIEMFLNDETISHICLLNSDVIIPDFWLDRLLNYNFNIVVPVTNKASGIQYIPIDFRLTLNRCLDPKSELIYSSVFNKVNNFAQNWNLAWKGNYLITEKEVTFFCAVISKSTIQKVGLLDTNFFPGGYEDYDYFLRVRAIDGKICLVRDDFIYHWGSASFSQLSRDYFNENSLRNRKYLENKHHIIWTDLPEALFISYSQDILFVMKKKGLLSYQKYFLKLYEKELTKILSHHNEEFNSFQKQLQICDRSVPGYIEKAIEQAAVYKNISKEWEDLLRDIHNVFNDNEINMSYINTIIEKLNKIMDNNNKLAIFNIEIESFLSSVRNSTSNFEVLSKKDKIIVILRKLRNGIIFFTHFHGIIIFGGYPYPEYEKDGYYQRVKYIDSLFHEINRIYIGGINLPGKSTWYDRPSPNVLVLNLNCNQKRRWFVQMCVILCLVRTHIIYFHSILAVRGRKTEILMRLPGFTKIVDIHGVVPEEFEYYNDINNQQIYNKIEENAIKNANYIIVVTNAMQRHFEAKYNGIIRGKFILLPIFQKITEGKLNKVYKDNKPIVVYAGGLQKWQQVPKMLDTIKKTSNIYNFRFYCPQPEIVRGMFSDNLIQLDNIVIDSKLPEELFQIYSECHFGFILREDIVVNRVACPTKLIEYLATGIIPIVDSDNIGDFKDYGMHFVLLSDILKGCYPAEEIRNQMARENFQIYKDLQRVSYNGSISVGCGR